VQTTDCDRGFMEGEKMRVLLEVGVWLADGDGDPARTLKARNAKEFRTMGDAQDAIFSARQFRPFPYAQVYDELAWKTAKRVKV